MSVRESVGLSVCLSVCLSGLLRTKKVWCCIGGEAKLKNLNLSNEFIG